MIIVEVLLYIPINKTFFYFCEKYLKPKIGARVFVPFKNKKLIGIIFKIKKTIKKESNFSLRKIEKILDNKPILTKNIIKVIKWTANYYHCSIGHLVFELLPKNFQREYTKKKNSFFWSITHAGKVTNIDLLKRSPKQQYAISILKKKDIKKNEILKYKLSKNIFYVLKKKGLCYLKLAKEKRISFYNFSKKKNILKKISPIEHLILKKILLNNYNFKSIVLTGVEYSLKKNIYLLILKLILIKKKQILILTPNINVLFRISYFLKRWTNVPIDVYHSKLHKKTQESVWNRSKKNYTYIVISTEKGIFIPFFKLGLIIVFKEESFDYIKKKNCSYNAKNVAILRAMKENIPILLESLSPDLSTLKNIYSRKYYHFNLAKKENIFIQKPPVLIDLNKSKCVGIFSEELIKEVQLTLKMKKTILIITSKKMIFFSVLMCLCCSLIMKCNKCNHIYKLNQSKKELFCHICLTFKQQIFNCMYCKSNFLHIYHINIYNIEKILRLTLKKSSFLFFNIMKKKYEYKKHQNFLYSTSKSPRIIFMSDQLDYLNFISNIKLVIFSNLDYFLYSFKFRAIELFSHSYINCIKYLSSKKTQAKIFAQTYFPKNTLLKTLFYKGINPFFYNLLKTRKVSQLPPYTVHIIIKIESKILKNVKTSLSLLYNLINKKFAKTFSSLLIMPFKISLINKFTNNYSTSLLLQHYSKPVLDKILNYVSKIKTNFLSTYRTKLSIIVSPINY